MVTTYCRLWLHFYFFVAKGRGVKFIFALRYTKWLTSYVTFDILP